MAIALAVASAASDAPIYGGLVALGEVGLAGEIRRISAVTRRLAEAARLGFTVGLVPEGSEVVAPAGMTVIEVRDIVGAVQAAARSARGLSLPRADLDERSALDSA